MAKEEDFQQCRKQDLHILGSAWQIPILQLSFSPQTILQRYDGL